jgi:DNA replication and repair protein RecF
MLRALEIRHFRCFEKFATEFGPGLNLIVGPNAHGKTSLLEAACILLRLQSPRVSRLTEVVQHERRGFVVDGHFSGRHLQFYYSAVRRKLALDGVPQATPREYLEIGRLVYFAMSDIELVRGSGETRRRFMDFVAVQLSAGYRQSLRSYERALRSRNSLLKAPAPRWREIEAFDAPLLAAGVEVSAARAALIEALQPHAGSAHAAISGVDERLAVEYVPGGGENFADSLKAARAEDARLRQTTVGPHRDDLLFRVNERASGFASEGQQRTLVLSLKLAAARLLQERFESAPLLLLDDIFGELDTGRRQALMAALPEAAQKVITTTSLSWWDPEPSAQILRLGGEG